MSDQWHVFYCACLGLGCLTVDSLSYLSPLSAWGFSPRTPAGEPAGREAVHIPRKARRPHDPVYFGSSPAKSPEKRADPAARWRYRRDPRPRAAQGNNAC